MLAVSVVNGLPSIGICGSWKGLLAPRSLFAAIEAGQHPAQNAGGGGGVKPEWVAVSSFLPFPAPQRCPTCRAC